MPETDGARSAAHDPARLDVIRQRAREEAPKHGRLLRTARDGRTLSRIMRPFYALATPPGHGVLTTTGRHSGRPRSMCIRAVRRGDAAYLVMLRPPALAQQRPDVVAAWIHNIRAEPRVRLRLGRRRFSGHAREITDTAELAAARAALCDTVHLVDYGECDLHLRGLPTREKIQDLHRYWFDTGIPVVVDLDHPRPG